MNGSDPVTDFRASVLGQGLHRGWYHLKDSQVRFTQTAMSRGEGADALGGDPASYRGRRNVRQDEPSR